MVDLTAFTNGMVEVLRRIPELIAELSPSVPESVMGYIDIQPGQNAVASAIYGQRPGSVLVVWRDAMMTVGSGGIANMAHHADLYVRAQRNQSPFRIIHAVTNGVPDPGDGQRWYVCPWLDGLQRTEILTVERETDTEQIDLMVIRTETYEQGDP